MGCAINCFEVEELAADYAAGRLLWIERWRYRAHLATCRACRRQLEADAAGTAVAQPGVGAGASVSRPKATRQTDV